MENVLSTYCMRAVGHFDLNRRNARTFMRQKGPMELPLEDRFEAIARTCEDRLCVYGTWRTFPIEPLEGKPGFQVVRTPLALPGKSISTHLKDATHAVLMAFTLGMEYEREASRIGAANSLDALMFDACASSLLESGADEFQAKVECDLESAGCRTTGFRYSPGYGDLPLHVQQDFLDVLDASRHIGVFANDDSFLIPAKSITAILGVTPEIPLKGHAR